MRISIVVGALALGLGLVGSNVLAHTANRNDGHGDCDSSQGGSGFPLSPQHDWRMHGTSADDNCNGHGAQGGSEDDDYITTDGGRDDIVAEAGPDEVESGDDGDLINGGDGNDFLVGGDGGGVPCHENDSNSRCERIDGGVGVDDVWDQARDNDYDRVCDGGGSDTIRIDDGDVRDIWIADRNDGVPDAYFFDPGDLTSPKDVCGF